MTAPIDLLLAAATSQDDVTTLSGIQQTLAKAWVDGDRATIERLIAPEWRCTGPDGRTSDRAEVLAEVFHRYLRQTQGALGRRRVSREPDGRTVGELSRASRSSFVSIGWWVRW